MVPMRTAASKQGLVNFCRYIHTIVPTKKLRMVEIGCFAGDSTEIFCNHFRNVVAIDPWKSNIGDITNTVDMDKVYKIFESKLFKYENITVLKHYSYDVVDNFDDGTIDIVYIDGSHKHDDVARDIGDWLPKVKKGGFISGHDYCKKFKGVMMAVNKLVGKPDRVFKDYSWIKRI